MAGITKEERARRAALKAEKEALLKENGLYCEPTCKVCRKTADKTEDYKYYEEPLKELLSHERLTHDGKFYCTKCYIKAGMPLF